MRLTLLVDGDVSATLRVHGEVELADAVALRRGLHQLLGADPAVLTVDLSDVPALDPRVGALLYRAGQDARLVDQELVLAGARDAVLGVLTRLGLRRRLRLVPVGPVPAGTDGRREAFLPLPSGPASTELARSFVEAACARWSPEQAQAAGLVTQELAANAVAHAGGDFAVEVAYDGHSVVVAVSDTSCATTVHGPVEGLPGGLQRVAALARSWGVDRDFDGKSVWAELSQGSSRAPARPA